MVVATLGKWFLPVTSIALCSMRDTPGIMSQMPPLPVSIDEDLANTILPNISQVIQNQFLYAVYTYLKC